MVRLSQASSGILPRSFPDHRIGEMVARMLTASPDAAETGDQSAMAQSRCCARVK